MLRSLRFPLVSPLLVFALVAACTPVESESGSAEEEATVAGERAEANPLKNAYFGDLHVHTRHSFDAYVFGVRASPDDAYRFAKGGAIQHPNGDEIKLKSGPLDFQAVTDHGFFLGVMPSMAEPGHANYETPLAEELRPLMDGRGFARAIQAIGSGELAALDNAGPLKDAWQDIIAAAERHNDPGVFTTFVAYEYTSSTDDQGNLHRNVVFEGAPPDLPFTRLDSRDPEDLWAWLDGLRENGVEGLAIPHNSNGSNGHMFALETFDGEPLDAAYAETRMRNEPIIELVQVKGSSEVHPLLAPNDEWADFEIFPYRIATSLYSEPSGGYAREAWRNGLVLEETQGFNPFRFGVLASTDSHLGAGTPEEDNYFSKVGNADHPAWRRGSVPDPEGNYRDANSRFFGAAGLAGVWAEENTRESIYAAFRRKETFATSGPRIRVRFFAGYDLPADLPDRDDMIASAYEGGVPMGADLTAVDDDSPSFLLTALRDPDSAPLQRLQIVKVWLEEGEGREEVIDVACSDGSAPDPETRRCADNGAAVDLSDCSYSQDVGASELATVWKDDAFDPAQHALYYLRVIENPTCRWSTWDALRAGVDRREDLPATIQERAWSSPIWIVPTG